MGNTSYKKAHMNEAITIPVSQIKLSEAIHNSGKKYIPVGKSQSDCCVIVRKGWHKYNLVSGWGDYQECIAQGYDTVKAIVENNGRGKFMRQYSNRYMPISEIKVPEYFARFKPRDWKIQRVRSRLGNKNRLDKPITLDRNNFIRDGYTRYLVAKEVGIRYVPVRFINN